MSPPPMSDAHVDPIQLSAGIDADCWSRSHNQPVTISVYLNLKPSFLDVSGQSSLRASHQRHLSAL
jgi:predicted component of type VI protein secretion system